MNRELFIADYRRLVRTYPMEAVAEVLADYVKDIPKNPAHAMVEVSVCPDRIIALFCQHYGPPLETWYPQDFNLEKRIAELWEEYFKVQRSELRAKNAMAKI